MISSLAFENDDKLNYLDCLSEKIPQNCECAFVIFCIPDDFIATLEGSSKSEGAVRVYLNWKADLTKYPMRARVAGDLTSLRQCKRDSDEKRMEVVAIPLKRVATCIGIDGSTGNLGVGVGRGVLVYAVCCKLVECEDGKMCGFEDMKCLLELTFDFNVKQVALCEEYIAVASDIQFQVVRLNLKSIPPPTKDGIPEPFTLENCPYLKDQAARSSSDEISEVTVNTVNVDKEDQVKEDVIEQVEALTKPPKAGGGSSAGDSGLESSSSHSEDGGSANANVSTKKPNRRMFSRQSSNSHTASSLDEHLTSSSSTEETTTAGNLTVLGTTKDSGSPPSSIIGSEQSSLRSFAATVIEEPNPIIEDEFHVVLNVNGADDGVDLSAQFNKTDQRNLAGLGSTSMEQKTVILNNIQKARDKHSEQNARKRKNYGTEILGPKLKHPICPVRVEYECKFD